MGARINNTTTSITLASVMRIIAYSNTPAEKHNAAAYEAVHTHSISAINADYDRILVQFSGSVTSTPNNGQDLITYWGIWKDATQITGEEINTTETTARHAWGVAVGGTTVRHNVSGSVVLIAGTNYTKGTAFTIYIKAKANANSELAYVYKSQVIGWNT